MGNVLSVNPEFLMQSILFRFMITQCYVHCSSNHQNISEPAYELAKKPTFSDVEMDKNPAYSVADAKDTSEDHHYDFIPDSGHAKVKKQI